MKLKEYMQKLSDFVLENPEAKELDVITSIDDEGNGFNPVFYGPSLGYYEKVNKEFTPVESFKECSLDAITNAVCLN